jgi:hypothetical protein
VKYLACVVWAVQGDDGDNNNNKRKNDRIIQGTIA